MKPICVDANVFIASTKGSEPYSPDCRRVIQAVVDGEFYLIEPTICFAYTNFSLLLYVTELVT